MEQQLPGKEHGEREVHALLNRIELIEAQPLEDRSAGYDQLAEELLADLQRSDHGHSGDQTQRSSSEMMHG